MTARSLAAVLLLIVFCTGVARPSFAQRPDETEEGLSPFTPTEWIPKRLSPDADQDGNFVDDSIDALFRGTRVNVILCLNGPPTAAELADFARFGILGIQPTHLSVVQVQNVRAGRCERLARRPRVAYVELEQTLEYSSDVAVPAIKVSSSSQYSGQNVEEVYPGLDGSGVTIAVLDSGVDDAHELFTGAFVGGYDLELDAEGNPDDELGHGTHVAGIALGRPTGTMRGVAPGASLIDVRVAKDASSLTSARVLRAIDLTVDRHLQGLWDVDVMNLSLGGGDSDGRDSLSVMADMATRAGICVVAALGNDSRRSVPAPAAGDGVIAVSATDDRSSIARDDDVFASFSNFGPRLDGEQKPELCAPGTKILSARFDTIDQYENRSGTSMAAPFVAGVAALLAEQYPGSTADGIRARLIAAAERLTSADFHPQFGHGLLDGFGSVEPPKGEVLLELPGNSATTSLAVIELSGGAGTMAAVGRSDGNGGVVRVYLRASGSTLWVPFQDLRPADEEPTDGFGLRMAFTAKPVPRLAVTSLYDEVDWRTNWDHRNGTVSLFELSGATFQEVVKIVPDPADDIRDFGQALAFDEDRLIVGSTDNLVRVHRDQGGSWSEVQQLHPTSGNELAFGFALAADGGLLAVGDFGDSTADRFAGSCWTYRWTGSGYQLESQLLPDRGMLRGCYFGSSIALDGDRLLVGASDAWENGGYEGALYSYVRGASTWQSGAYLTLPSGSGQRLEGGIALDGDLCVAGSVRANPNSRVAPSAIHFFELTGSSYTLTDSLSSIPEEQSYLWNHLSLAGETVLVAVSRFDDFDIAAASLRFD